MDNESEGAYVRVVVCCAQHRREPAERLLARKANGRPKMGKVSGSYSTLVYGIHSVGDPA